MRSITNFLNDESGASAAEYALIIALIGLAIVGAASLLGTSISTALTNAANKMTAS